MVDGASGQLYTCAQLVLREYVGRFHLDELLAQKEEIGQYVLQKLRERQEEFCVEVMGAGIKDIILPGEIREIMNTVLVAEKKAQANVITVSYTHLNVASSPAFLALTCWGLERAGGDWGWSTCVYGF